MSADDAVERLHAAALRPTSSRGGSWTPEPSPGSYGPLPAWTSGEAWFDAVLDALATPAGEDLRRSAKVARDTLLRVARADWLSADADTGRSVTTAHDTVAAGLGMCGKTVQRSRALLEAFGFATTVPGMEGRYLTRWERQQATSAHGGHQLRVASTRALIMPRPSHSNSRQSAPSNVPPSQLVVENVQLPRRGTADLKTHPFKTSPRRANARNGVASRQPRPNSFRRATQRDRLTSPRSLEMQRFAAELVVRIPWLARNVHIGRLIGMLERTGIDIAVWSVPGLLSAMDVWLRREGIRMPDTFTSTSPLGFYSWLIRQVIVGHSEYDSRRAAGEHSRQQRRLEAERERAVEEARVSQIDQVEVDRIIARMKVDYQAHQRAVKEREDVRRRDEVDRVQRRIDAISSRNGER